MNSFQSDAGSNLLLPYHILFCMLEHIIATIRPSCIVFVLRTYPAPPAICHAIRRTARTAHLLLLMRSVLRRALRARDVLIAEDQQGWGVAVVGVDVLLLWG
jgi:hypothetical protein